MFKFFRNIRKKLLSEGKSKNYLKYAIGEIVLVVIGILIALSVNNWNEQRKNNRIELDALKDLLQEFKGNQTVFNEQIAIKKNARKVIGVYLELMKSGKVTIKDVETFRRLDNGGATFNPSRGVIGTVLSTGIVNKIQNKKLKYILTSYNDILLDYQEDETMYLDFLTRVDSYEVSIIPYNGIKFHDMTIKTFDQLYFGETKKLVHRNNVIEMVNHLTFILDEGEVLKNNVDTIISLLTSEIQRLE